MRRTNDLRVRWSDLDPRLRQALLIGGAFETGLKIATLIDLAQRPRSAIRGSKSLWALTPPSHYPSAGIPLGDPLTGSSCAPAGRRGHEASGN
ncbi:MAG: hypothetical protein EOP28_04740 [Rhodococcus sp. (in: high G+C Gram-positive bacteria)]|nr:MAG: hypothetical protein EOP28_04740 [Rhodococcus sp. (in: high G+C Gram-positive bacteria)]